MATLVMRETRRVWGKTNLELMGLDWYHVTVIMPKMFLADGRPLSGAGEGSIRSEVPFDNDVLGEIEVSTGLFVVLK